MSVVLAFRGKDGGFTLEHFAKSFDLYPTDLLFTRRHRAAVDAADRHRRDRHRRLPDAGRESARGGDPALALSLAAVHSVHRHRPGHAHLPRQERHAEPRADRQRADRAAVRAEPARLARHRRRVRLEAGAVRDAAAGRRDGVARAAAHRGRAQSRRARGCGCWSTSCCRRCAARCWSVSCCRS